MLTRAYTLRFVTPAFLGNAEQNGQWRTPPIKALLRQWWRVVYTAEQAGAVNVAAMRAAEGRLFGVAAERKGASSQSLLRLRLDHWDCGTLDNTKWPRPNIRELQVGQGRVPADVYIGFGPVLPASRKESQPPRLGRTAIAPDVVENTLRLMLDRRCTDDQHAELLAAVALCQWFGCLGSRSRNGWGSLSLSGEGLTPLPTLMELRPYLRPLERCFDADWAHAIGSEAGRPLVWKGITPAKNWREAVLALAQIRFGIRAAAKKFGRNRAISANQLIAYPVTQSGNDAWGQRERFASPLRLKVHRTPQGLVPWGVHLPCALPAALLGKLDANDQRWVRENQLPVWQAVHRELDKRMRRLGDSA
jgi:CRISPR-associated protein Cmr1